jgi:hypothetical protein
VTRRKNKQAPPAPQQIRADGWPSQTPAEIDRDNRIWHGQRRVAQHRHLVYLQKALVDHKYFPAIIDALDYCHGHKLPIPEWLFQAIVANLSYHYWKHSKLSKRCEAMTKKRNMHLERYALIDEAKIHGVKWNSRDFDIFEHAAEISGGNASNIRKSYRKVAAALKRDRAHDFYVAKVRKVPIGVKKPSKKG